MYQWKPQPKGAGNTSNSGGISGIFSSGISSLGSGLKSLFGSGGRGAAAIKRATVGMPTKTDYTVDPASRPTVGQPNARDYAYVGKRPTVALPTRSDFGDAPSKQYIDQAARDVKAFRTGFNDPTHTTAFQNLMGYTEETTGAQEADIARQARDASSRAGYAGGFSQAAKQAARDRMTATATAGFAGAAQIRAEELTGYGTATQGLAAQVGSYNDTMSKINVAFGNALAGAHETQAKLDADLNHMVQTGQLSYAEAKQRSKEAQGTLDLGFADLVQKGNLGYADAKAAASQLQAQLDQAYNGSLIDNARYKQMSESLKVEWARAQAALAEQAREFDVTQGESKRRFDLTRGDTLADIAKQRTTAGVNPRTGERTGPTNYWQS